MRESGRDRVYQFLKREVLTDPALQGQFINEQQVADQVGVSRTPVREALLMLSAEELVQLVPKRGAYLAPMSGRQITELMELRGILERFAAPKAMDPEILGEMRAALAAQHLVKEPGQAKEFIEQDTRFHTALVRACGNEMLSRMYEGLRDRQIRAGLVAVFRLPGRQDGVLSEHQAIIDALEAGDAEAAEKAIDAHLGTTLSIQLTT